MPAGWGKEYGDVQSLIALEYRVWLGWSGMMWTGFDGFGVFRTVKYGVDVGQRKTAWGTRISMKASGFGCRL